MLYRKKNKVRLLIVLNSFLFHKKLNCVARHLASNVAISYKPVMEPTPAPAQCYTHQ